MSRSSRIVRDSSGGAVIFGDGGPIILSGGVPHVLAMSTDGGKAAIRLVDPTGQSTAVLDGSVPDVSAAYAVMCSDLKRPLRRDWRNFSLGVAAGAVMAAAILGAVSASIVAGAWRATSSSVASSSPPLLPSAAPGLPGIVGDTPGLIPALEELQRRSEAEQAASPKPAPAALPRPAEAPSAPEATAKPLPAPIVDRPDFLNIPAAAGQVPASPPAPLAPVAAPADGLPPYVAPQAPVSPAASVQPLDDVVSQALEKSGSDQAVDHVAPAAAEPQAAEHATAEEGKSDAPAVAQSAAAEPIPAAKVPAPKPSGTGKASPAVAEAARQKALTAARAMVANGLTPDKAADVLSQLEALGNTDADKITPAMLSTLPHEVAQMLLDNGLAGGESAPDGVQYSIIRVPESVIDAHRGPDGIADIPERNTWVSNGNYVSIPLPGGGDVKSPDDLKAFHLQP